MKFENVVRDIGKRLQELYLHFKGRVSKFHLLLKSEFISKVKRYKHPNRY